MPSPPQLEVDFKITCGGHDAGTMIAGFAQERITNKSYTVNGVTTHPADDTDYTPATASGGSGILYKQGNLIIDMKTTNLPATDWAQINVGETFYTFTQTMRINWTDPCGTVQVMNLGSINLGRKKVSTTQWQLVPN